ncbi:hypothetical protein TNCV_723851 [Trichonephila clavipes]|nr:hypothetical protein TNCV_723851 [Trichonephila clavipes]
MIISTQVLLIIQTSLIAILLPTYEATRPKQNHEPCSPFPYATLENGKITSIGTQKYMFKCDPGYFLSSPLQVRCWKGKWSSLQKPSCSKIEGQCDDPPPIPGGRILGDLKYIGSIINYICNPGFILMGDRMRTCLESGHWSGITPACMDESEPVQKVAERLKKDFVMEMASHSSDSTMVMAKKLDADAVKNGLELIILIDRSSSIDPKDFKLGINFIKFLLAEFGVRNGNNPSGTRAAVLTFGNAVDIVFNLDNETIIGPQAASRALDTIQPNGGGTAMLQAIMSVFTLLPPLRPKAKKALFMITDGEPNIGEEEDTLYFANELKNKEDYEIFTVGIGKDINRQLLSKLASEPLMSHVFILDKYTELRNMMDIINDKSNRPKTISYALCGYIKHEKHFLKNWPWLAAIYVNRPDKEKNNHLRFCTGTLICSQWVITAASCFYHEHENNATEKEFEQVTKMDENVLNELNEPIQCQFY